MEEEAQIASLSKMLVKLGGILTEDSSDAEFQRFEFPIPADADYRFVVFVYSDGEAQICANRVGSDLHEYFWHMPKELPDYPSVADLHAELLEHLSDLLTHPTRIIQRTRWLSVSLDCEIEKGNSWLPVYGHSVFRGGNIAIPMIDGRQKTYLSPAVLKMNDLGS